MLIRVFLLEAKVDRLPFSPLGTTATMLYLVTYLLLGLIKLEKGLSTEWSTLQPEQVQLAARILAAAENFAPGTVGDAGVISREALAFRAVLGSPDSKTIFTRLLREHRPGAKLWGLAGLHFVDRGAYEIEAVSLRHSTEQVSFVYGCIPTTTTVASVVSAFDQTHLADAVLTSQIRENVWRQLKPPSKPHAAAAGRSKAAR